MTANSGINEMAKNPTKFAKVRHEIAAAYGEDMAKLAEAIVKYNPTDWAYIKGYIQAVVDNRKRYENELDNG